MISLKLIQTWENGPGNDFENINYPNSLFPWA